MPAAPLRTRRAVSAGAVCGAGAVVAHVLAGGAVPPLWLALLAAAVGAGACAPLSRARLDALGLAGAALLAQAVFHLGFSLHASSGHDGALLMLGSHLGAGAVSVAAALGVERAWWRLALAALGRLVPAVPRPTRLPSRRVLAPPLGRTTGPADAHHAPHASRGPPRGPAPVLASVRTVAAA